MKVEDELESSLGSYVTEDPSGIIARLEALRDGQPVAKFARKCGMGESTMRKYLKGSVPGLDRAAMIARAHHVNLQWLATGEGPMREEEVKEAGYLPQGIDRRTAALLGVLEALDQEQRDTILSDCLSRAQTAQQMLKLHQAIHDLEARLGKAS